MKAINSMQPARKEYRTLAEMELMAKRDHKSEKKVNQERPTKVEFREDGKEDELSGDWARLMGDIERITV